MSDSVLEQENQQWAEFQKARDWYRKVCSSEQVGKSQHVKAFLDFHLAIDRYRSWIWHNREELGRT
jgi:hypothetical protein